MKAKDNLSCGATLAAHVSSTVYGHAKAFNDTMDELKQPFITDFLIRLPLSIFNKYYQKSVRSGNKYFDMPNFKECQKENKKALPPGKARVSMIR